MTRDPQRKRESGLCGGISLKTTTAVGTVTRITTSAHSLRRPAVMTSRCDDNDDLVRRPLMSRRPRRHPRSRARSISRSRVDSSA